MNTAEHTPSSQSRPGLPPFVRFLQRWAINTVAVLVAANVVGEGIEYSSWKSLVAASLLLGVLNALLRPLLLILSLPLIVFTLGLFIPVINAFLLLLVGALPFLEFEVRDFSSAFWGGLVISLVTVVLNTVTGSGERRINLHVPHPRHGRRPGPPGPPGSPPPGQGPVIDV